MASRLEKTTRRVAGRVRQATKSAAVATRRASDVLDRVEKATRGLESSRTVKKASKAAGKLAKSAAVGIASVGLRRAVEAVSKKLARKKPSRGRKALKVAGAVAAVAGAAVVANKVIKSRRRANTGPRAMDSEERVEPGPEY
jgi:hypothetical protein